MSFSFTSLIRLVTFVVVGLNVVAVLLGRLGPEPRPTAWHLEPAPRHAMIDGKDVNPIASPIIDDQEGRPEHFELVEGEQFQHGACSPWLDQDGGSQIVGVRVKFKSNLDDRWVVLERLSYPSGDILDRVELEHLPTGPPCWLGDSPDRILFGSGDGKIYQYTFSSSTGLPGVARDAARSPRPLTWKTPPPGFGEVIMRHPSRPTDPRWGDRILVSLSLMEEPGADRLGPERIWWLRMDHQGTGIVAAGTLLEDDRAESAHRSIERKAAVTGSFEGRPLLAYLIRCRVQEEWQLCLSEVEFDPETSTPQVRAGSTRYLADHCGLTSPTFSTDGRWLSCVVDPRTPGARVARFSVDEVLARNESDDSSEREAASLSLVEIDAPNEAAMPARPGCDLDGR